MADGEAQVIASASASDDTAGVVDPEYADDRPPADLPLMWNSMDLPGMEDDD